MDPLRDYDDIWSLLSEPRESPATQSSVILSPFESRPRFSLAAYPDDVLLLIFGQLCSDFEARWKEHGRNAYDSERVFTPFIIAAVCVRWRTLALSLQRLWTYIALPRPSVHLSVWRSQKALITLALERSGTSAIDVLVQTQTSLLGRNNILWFLSAIGPHTSRWGRAELWNLRIEELDLFSVSTPALTHLVLHVNFFAGGHRPSPEFLPFAPRLCFLTVVDALLYRLEGHQGFPSLCSLVVGGDTPWLQARMFLVVGCMSLESATITIDDFPRGPDKPHFTLPRLRTLVLVGRRGFQSRPTWSWNCIIPSLTTLCLHGWVVSNSIAPLLRQVASTVTRLTLFGGRIMPESLAFLRELHSVSRLTFGTAGIRVLDSGAYTVSDEFFVAVAETTPPIWPLLTRIELGAYGAKESSFGEGLLRLIARRCRSNEELRASGVEAISEVVISGECYSLELKQEVARLMGA